MTPEESRKAFEKRFANSAGFYTDTINASRWVGWQAAVEACSGTLPCGHAKQCFREWPAQEVYADPNNAPPNPLPGYCSWCADLRIVQDRLLDTLQKLRDLLRVLEPELTGQPKNVPKSSWAVQWDAAEQVLSALSAQPAPKGR